jgi:hypothetical protein
MAPVTATAEVDRAAAEVFAYATDPTLFSGWQQGVVDGHLETDHEPTVGTKCVTTRRIGGSERTSTSEISHIDPPHTWGVRGIDGPIRAVVDLTVEPLGPARSRLTIAVDFTGHGIGKVLVPLLVRPQARKEMPKNVAALKEHIEADG